jgi:hypothetical protein
LLVPLTNPVILDAGGWAPAMYLDELTYKAVLTNALDVTIWTQDDIASIGQLITAITGPIEAEIDQIQIDLDIAEADIDALQAAMLLAQNYSVQARTDTGTVNDWALGLVGHTAIFWAGAAPLTITGVAGGLPGRILVFRNVGTQVATFAPNSGSSLAVNRLNNAVTSAGTPVAPGGWVTYIHSGTDWLLIGHDQGAAITVPFSAAHFTGSAGLTWTVTAGQRGVWEYRLSGKQVFVSFQLAGTTVSGTGTTLQMSSALFGGFAVPSPAFDRVGFTSTPVGDVYLTAGAGINMNSVSGANFSAGTYYTYGQMSFFVQ